MNEHRQPFFFIRQAGRFEKIGFADIRYVTANKNYARIVTEKRTYLVLVTLKRIQAVLPEANFCQVHRSFIVSLDKLTAFNNRTIYIGDEQFPIGDHYRGTLEQRVLILQEAQKTKIPDHAYG